MFLLAALSLWTLLMPIGHARAESIDTAPAAAKGAAPESRPAPTIQEPAPMPNQTRRWMRDVSDDYHGAKNLEQLAELVPSVTDRDFEFIRANFDLKMKLPKLTVDMETQVFRLGGGEDLKVIDLKAGEFEVNRHAFHFARTNSLMRNYQMASDLKTNATLWEDDELFFRSLKERTAADEATTGVTGVGVAAAYGVKTAASLIHRSASLVAAALIATALTDHYDEAAAPPCGQQLKEIRQLLLDAHLGLTKLNCDWQHDDPDAKKLDANIGFFVENESPREFAVDWRRGLAWEEPRSVLIFKDESLDGIRERHLNAVNHRSERFAYRSGDVHFEHKKMDLAKFGKLFHFFGVNQSCLKCEDEIRKELVKPLSFFSKPAPTERAARPEHQ